MLETILKLYTMAMACDTRSPMPHLYGPPGANKSTVVAQAAEILEVSLHILNVSRISPLETEGVQMPHGSGEEMVLRMLPATFWTQLKENDIVLLEEFLRGFPEVYNALLDIFTSRRVGAFALPPVFIIGCSNSTVTYDKALEDRLLHIPVEDPRKNVGHKKHLAKVIVDKLGLMPEMAESGEMTALLDLNVLPMFDMLDSMGTGSSSSVSNKGKSVRNLIGQAELRHIVTPELSELIDINNRKAMTQQKYQYILLPDGKRVDPSYPKKSMSIPEDKLTAIQLRNRMLNHQLIGLEEARQEQEIHDGEPVSEEPPF